MTRRRRFHMPEILLDRASPQPMYLQFRTALERAIQEGRLAAGSRLPSTRQAAKLFSVSRTTVLTAYEMLAAEGLIESAIGSGTRVRATRMIPPIDVPNWKALIREVRYPAPVMNLEDPDGNGLYLSA